MKKAMITALAAATMLLPFPAAAQEVPLIPSDYWEVTEVDVQDGQFGAYADYLATQWRRNQEFSKSKGWMKDYFVLSTVKAFCSGFVICANGPLPQCPQWVDNRHPPVGCWAALGSS